CWRHTGMMPRRVRSRRKDLKGRVEAVLKGAEGGPRRAGSNGEGRSVPGFFLRRRYTRRP
ncbi:MAG: hypothetical protein ABL983_16360, partial [Nitrospira sp.]